MNSANWRQEEAAHHAEELAEHNEACKLARQMGLTVPGSKTQPGAEEAVAYLKQLPLHLALRKAREWTGDTRIFTLDQAVAAVEAALGGGGEQQPQE